MDEKNPRPQGTPLSERGQRRSKANSKDDEEEWVANRTPSPSATSQSGRSVPEHPSSSSPSRQSQSRQSISGRGKRRGNPYPGSSNPYPSDGREDLLAQRSLSPQSEDQRSLSRRSRPHLSDDDELFAQRSLSPSSSRQSGRRGRPQTDDGSARSDRPYSPSSQRSWQRRSTTFETFEPLRMSVSPSSSEANSRRPSKSSRSSRPRRTWRSDEAEMASVASESSQNLIIRARTEDIDDDEIPEPPIERPVYEEPPRDPPPVQIPVVRVATPPPVIRPETPEPVWETAPENPRWPNPIRDPVDYSDVHAKCVDAPLELAALAKMRAWERGPEAVYTLEEAMDVVRWLELQLDSPKGDSSQLWEVLCDSPRRIRVWLLVGGLLFLAVLLVSVGLLTAAALETHRVASIETSGMLTATTHDGTKQTAAAALAVNTKSLLDYPSLPLEELRRAQDVVFQKDGSFHFHRLSSATSVQGGAAVHLVGEDGTIIQVESGQISVAPPFARQGPIDAAGLGLLEQGRDGSSLAFVGAFRTVVPL